jgi:hypothetical protein
MKFVHCFRGDKLFFRIIEAPPGYAPDQKYLVAAYETKDPSSRRYNVKKADGTLFAATLEEARRMMPDNATPLSFEPDSQLLELWEAEENPVSDNPVSPASPPFILTAPETQENG